MTKGVFDELVQGMDDLAFAVKQDGLDIDALIRKGIDVDDVLYAIAITPNPNGAVVDRNVKICIDAGASFSTKDSYLAPREALRRGRDDSAIGAFIKHGFDLNVDNGQFL